ncbi:MAG: hypothetical protein KA533_02835 [Sphingobium sp.]|nr:hypothetical protein [Sphingobium sp.]MBP6112038.1 hypothetical protein [Sphingobium sp.]MBP8669828.1 hypothetical protein [Sphingobium sp.]MBP9156412.1 hypothetical protein [Sphingobium sp.]MCC6483082.1 hypothetical protein [Sphingomonadaceae bacterium]
MSESHEELNRQKRTASIVSALWLALLAGVFVWQASQYRGVVELLAEWQYRVLDHYYPGITIALLCLFFSFPLLAMLFILWRRWHKKNEAVGNPVTVMTDASRRLQRMCTFLALLASGVAAGVLLLARMLPTEGMPVHLIDVRSAQARLLPEGSASVVGAVDMDALVRFEEQALLFYRRIYFAPVRYRIKGQTLPARVFVQVEERADLPRHYQPVMNGVLAQGALPGDVDQLYRNVRYPVVERPYLLYRTSGELRWRYHMLAVQMAIMALLFALAAWRENRRRARIEKRVEQPTG